MRWPKTRHTQLSRTTDFKPLSEALPLDLTQQPKKSPEPKLPSAAQSGIVLPPNSPCRNLCASQTLFYPSLPRRLNCAPFKYPSNEQPRFRSLCHPHPRPPLSPRQHSAGKIKAERVESPAAFPSRRLPPIAPCHPTCNATLHQVAVLQLYPLLLPLGPFAVPQSSSSLHPPIMQLSTLNYELARDRQRLNNAVAVGAPVRAPARQADNRGKMPPPPSPDWKSSYPS